MIYVAFMWIAIKNWTTRCYILQLVNDFSLTHHKCIKCNYFDLCKQKQHFKILYYLAYNSS